MTIGPVQMCDNVLSVGKEQVPYFRTGEFSLTMLENENLMLRFSEAPLGSRAVFFTGSGTASMESTVMNVLSEKDRALVVDGGSFGRRFCQLCEIHRVAFDSIKLERGRSLVAEDLLPFEGAGYTAFLVNIHETSTGVLYDIDLISDFCRRNNLLLVVDAISSFLADSLSMSSSVIDVLIAGSQKALACPPGISVVVLSPRALARVEAHESKSMYLDLKSALSNGERGQTPFTPAVSILLQINARLKDIEKNGGAAAEIDRVRLQAADFRSKLVGLPLDIASERMSNAATPLRPRTVSARLIFKILKDEYGIWVCPNGGDLADRLFRVGHIGELSFGDNDLLIAALGDMVNRGVL